MLRSVLLLLGRVRAFVVRDFQLAVSYRLEFFMRILSILFVTTTLFFISQIFAKTFSTPSFLRPRILPSGRTQTSPPLSGPVSVLRRTMPGLWKAKLYRWFCVFPFSTEVDSTVTS